MLHKLKLLLAVVAMSSVSVSQATYFNFDYYQQINVNADDRDHAELYRFVPRKQGTSVMYEDWATINYVVNPVIQPTRTVPDAYGTLAGEYTVTSIHDHAFHAYADGDVLADDQGSMDAFEPTRWEFIQCVKTIQLPSTITTIGNEVFKNARSLTTINIPASVTALGDGSFENCTALNSVDFQANLSDGKLPNNTFKGCTSLTEITLPASITSLGAGAFEGCTALTTINIEASSFFITPAAFDGIDNLEGITFNIPENAPAANFTLLKELGATVVGGVEEPVEPEPVEEVHQYPMTMSGPVTSLENGKFYYIYDAHGDNGTTTEQAASNTIRYAFRKASGTNIGAEVQGTHKKPFNAWVENTLDNFSVWKAIQTESGAWIFQNVGTSTFMGNGTGSGKANTLVEESNATAVVLEEVTDQPGTFTVRVATSTPNATNNNALRWDGQGNPFKMVYYNGQGHPICFYEAVPENNGFTFATSPNTNAPEYTIDSSNPHYYLIKNLRVRNGRGPTYATAPAATGQISLRTESELKQYAGRYELGALWYFMPSEGRSDVATPRDYNALNIYNALTGQALANVLGGDWRTEGDDIVWYITENSASGDGTVYSGFNILSQPDKTNTGYGWNNAQGNGFLVEYWKGNDVGSIFAFELADEELAAKTIDAIVINRLPLAIEKGNKLKALGVNTDEAIAAWDEAVAAAEDEHHDTTIEEYQAVVSAYINLQKSVKEVSVKIKHKSHEYEYLGVDTETGNISCIGDADDATVGKGTRVFTLLPAEDGSGFYLYNVHSDCYIVHPNNNTNNVSTTSEKSAASIYNFDVWVNGSQADGSIGIYEINSKPDVAYLRSTDDNNKVVRGAFNSADASWFITTVSDEAVEGDQLAGAADKLTGDCIPRGNALVGLNIYSEAAVNAWNTAVSNFETADPYTSEIIEAVNNAYANLIKSIDITTPVSFTARHKGCGTAYISVNEAGSIVESANYDGTRALTLSMAADGSGFNIFSEYAGKYLVHPTGDNASVTLTTDKSQASIYIFDALVNSNKTVDSFLFGEVNYLKNNPDRAYFNTNTNLDIVTRWSYGAGSAWYLTVVSDDQAATEYLNGSKAAYNRMDNIGSGMGKYSLTDGAAIESALAVTESASIEQKRQAGATLRNPQMTINLPQPGHIYEFAKADESKYLSCENLGTTRATMVTQTQENLLSTLFYLDEDYHLVALEDGKVLGCFNRSDNDASWHTVLLSDTQNAGVYNFAESSRNGKYNIITHDHSNGVRYLYNTRSDVDCGDDPGNDAGYCWTIFDKGEYTPIPGTGADVERTTIVLPFAMYRKPNMTFYTAQVNNGKVILEEFTDEVIPANTPFILDLATNVERDSQNHLVYLQRAASEGNAPENNDLCGSIYAVANDGFATREGDLFKPATGDVVYGMQAYLSDAKLYTISNTAIEKALDNLVGKVFALKNTDTANNRGYIIYDPAQEAVWTSGKAGSAAKVEDADVDAVAQTNTNYHWTLVKDANGHRYLYNIAAGKFAACYMKDTFSNSYNVSEFVWHFSDYPTAIDFCFYETERVDNIENARFNILGGEKIGKQVARPAGLYIANGFSVPVFGTLGTGVNDGCIFTIKMIEGATAGEVASADAALKAMAAEHAQAKDYIANYNEDNWSLPGHYNADGYAAFSAALQGDAADTQAKYYQLVRARNAAGDENINQFENGGIYVIPGYYANAYTYPGQKEFYVVVEDHPHDFIESRPDAASSNVWQCSIDENGNVNFSHTFSGFTGYTQIFEKRQQSAVRARVGALNSDGTIDVPMFDESVNPTYKNGLGDIEVADTGKPLNVSSLANADDLVTTGISEITADVNSAYNTVYDLQGRRVAKATRGLYIVNGQKTLLK